jgi:hypothetical protein
VKHFHNYVLEHHIITEHQSGFQPKDSTVDQLVYIYNTIISKLDIGKDIMFIFCDISKAFDRVWHTGLLYKLRKRLHVSVSKYMEVVHIAMTD